MSISATTGNDFTIQEDNRAFYALSCIPVTGLFFTSAIEHSLSNKIYHSKDPLQIFDLATTKGRYLKIDVYRNLFVIASLIAGIAKEIISNDAIPAMLLLGAVHLFHLGMNFYCIYKNNQLLNEANKIITATVWVNSVTNA